MRLEVAELFSNETEGMNSKEDVKQGRCKACEPRSLLQELSFSQAQEELLYSPQMLITALSLIHSSLLSEFAVSLST